MDVTTSYVSGSYNLSRGGRVVQICKKFSDSHETFSVCQFMYNVLLMVRTDNVMSKKIYKPCTCIQGMFNVLTGVSYEPLMLFSWMHKAMFVTQVPMAIWP